MEEESTARSKSTRRTLWWLAGVVIVIIVSTVIATYTNRDNLIADCQRDSAFKNTVAEGWEKATETRRLQGDFGPAETYASIAEEIRATIPMPRHYEGETLRGSLRSDRVGGCQDAYPPPLPGR